MKTRTSLLLCWSLLNIASNLWANPTHRLYDGLTAFVNNPEGKEFTLDLDVRDINHRMHGPSELLVKIYDPEGKLVAREIIPDDGVLAHTTNPWAAGWDHEAWYYATSYSRGMQPQVRWSAFSDPTRLAAMQKRSFQYKVKSGLKGVYRILLVGTPDHYVTLRLPEDLPYSVAGSPEWIHGHHDQYRKSYIYVPKTTRTINVLFLQLDEPATRNFTLRKDTSEVLAKGSGSNGLVQVPVEASGTLDDQILTLEVSEGRGDFLLNVTHQLANEFVPVRAKTQAVTALLSPDKETARATQGGAIYHDGQVFWQRHQVRLHDWLKKLNQEDFAYPPELEVRTGFVSVGSHNSPKQGSADRLMHSWMQHRDKRVLNAAYKDMLFGMRLIGHGDHVAIGPKRNLAYEQGCYTFFWYRPAWRILQETDAPTEVKEAIQDFIIQTGDRLGFCRTISTGNGNAFGSLMAGLRYCYAASGDTLQKKLFEDCWKRFTTGGYGDRFGIGPSGGLQESLGYDFHYGSYVMRGWNAVIADFQDERFIHSRNRMWNLYSYIWSPEPANPWSGRTAIPKTAGDTYDPLHDTYSWKGYGGADFVTEVNDHNEWFAARRKNYYVVTYHGRLTPTWQGEGFHGQIGLGGGGITQLQVPGHGQVITSRPNGDYGSGMHVSEWQNFHVHSLVGTTTDGQPLVGANSEHFNAKLEGDTVTSSGNVRQSSVNLTRSYQFGKHAIECEVQMNPAQHDNVFSIWGGLPKLRGKVTEAWEMIPFADLPKPQGRPRPEKGRTRVEALMNNQEAIPLTEEAIEAQGVLVDRGGYGMLIEFDKARAVHRGLHDTLMIEVAKGYTPAAEVGMKYRILPYAGDPPKLGDLEPPGQKPIPLTQLPKDTEVQDLPKLLAETQHFGAKNKTQVIGNVRFGISGDRLAVLANVTDRQLVRGSRLWDGSSVEVFASLPDSLEIVQLILNPATDDHPAVAHQLKNGNPLSLSNIELHSTKAKSGYQLSALIPLKVLGADSTQTLRLESQISSHNSKVRTYGTLFKSKAAYQNNSAYRLFGME